MSKMKHTPEPWRQYVRDLGDQTDPAYREIKAGCGYYTGEEQEEKGFAITGYISEDDAARIVDCVNACAEMEKPTVEIPAMKAEIAALKARIEELTAAPTPTTVEGWLKLLPDGYRERALGQCDCPTRPALSMTDAIIYFAGTDIPQEAHDFYSDLYDHYTLGTPLPELPNN
jgi:hypothetical protein